MDCSPGIIFESIIVNVDEAKSSTNRNQRGNKSQATKAVPVRLHTALTDYLQGFPRGGCYTEGRIIGLGDGNISI